MTPIGLLTVIGEIAIVDAIYTVFLIDSIKLWLRQGETGPIGDILLKSVDRLIQPKRVVHHLRTSVSSIKSMLAASAMPRQKNRLRESLSRGTTQKTRRPQITPVVRR